ncbi:MAG: M1 family aminopeptidase, partial [Bacteroidota bacterium]
DMNWDYIIVHETGHEYFGNSISVLDHAEMWIHESFTTYMEALYVEYHYDEAAARRYLRSQLPYIRNQAPMLGPLDVNFDDFSSSDHYYKGSWMLHTMRNAIDDDERWWQILRGFYDEFKQSIVSTPVVVDYFAGALDEEWVRPFFEQYLMHPELPELKVMSVQSRGSNGVVWQCRWETEAEDFAMPVSLIVNGEVTRVNATSDWMAFADGPNATIELAPDEFLIEFTQLN